MYNTDIPNRADLPSAGKLLRSTAFAFVAAVALLVTTVLPADYGVDPTGIGARLGLTDMGETKVRLQAEAEADRAATAAPALSKSEGKPEIAELSERIASLEVAIKTLVEKNQIAGVAPAQVQPEPAAEVAQAQAETEVAVAVPEPKEDLPPAPQATEPPEPMLKSDQVSFTLSPGEGVEIKLVMKKDAQTSFQWTTEGGPVNFDIHADGPGQPTISYEKGRGVDADDGVILAAFDGNHGWFWRNRGKQDVKLTLRTEGEYSTMKGVPQQ